MVEPTLYIPQPIFRRGQLVYSHADSYNVTTRNNLYVGLVLEDCYSLEDAYAPYTSLKLMNFHCKRLDSTHHLFSLPLEDIISVVSAVRDGRASIFWDRTRGMHSLSLDALLPFHHFLGPDSPSNVVNCYLVGPEHFTLLTAQNLSGFLNTSLHHFPISYDANTFHAKLKAIVSPFQHASHPLVFL